MLSQKKNSTIVLDLDLITSASGDVKNGKNMQLEDPVFGLICWWSLVCFLKRRSRLSTKVTLFESDISSSGLSIENQSLLTQHWPIVYADDTKRDLSYQPTFAYASSSQALSVKIFDRFTYIQVRPTGLPGRLATDQFWYTSCGTTWIAELRSVLNKVFPGQWLKELDALELNLKPANPPVTAVSSIYNGDDFLKGFLENASSWDDYATCEHLLIRAGSSGQEHNTLKKHIDKNPNAVYINLENDPGLYQVWNIGVQLSTAPYLTNANIDDRRAPQQVSSLAKFLNQHPSVSVVSTKLRVTHTPNMTWEDSNKYPVMFAHEPIGSYKVDRLFRYENNNAMSRNLPHCMPLWRRYLHNYAGLFKEERYGPSADWEFWLSTGILGAQFAFLAEPMGLYLQHEQSYWHREKDTDFDQRIVHKYAFFAQDKMSFNRVTYPLSQRINEVLIAHSAKDALSILSGLVDCVLRSVQSGTGNKAQALIDNIATRSLGFNDFSNFLENHQGAFISMEDPLENALSLTIELLHSRTFHSNVPWRKIIEKALIDHFLLTRSIFPLVSLAFFHHKLNNGISENKTLELASNLAPMEFWPAVSRVYRFKVNLNEMTARYSNMSTPLNLFVKKPSKLKLWFYPVYSSNKYTRLLYEDIVKKGAFVEGITHLDQFDQITPDPKCMNVVHIHWVNEFVDNARGSFPEGKGQLFLSQLQRLKEKGFEIRWTIHNRLSHQSIEASKEIHFRQSMYNLADRVYLHHPMAVQLVDWITDNGKKCSLVEHGHYLSLFGSKISRKAAREQLGFEQNDFIMLHIGLLRDYKGLNDFLPIVKRVSKAYPHFKLVIAGRIDSTEIRQSLNAIRCPNIIVREAYLSDDEIDLYTNASDIGFLSYKSILTSGTLFHLLSGGLPIISPNLGTIPAYIVKGWNGFLYEEANDLENILIHCCKLPKPIVNKMSHNALNLATSLDWRYF